MSVLASQATSVLPDLTIDAALKRVESHTTKLRQAVETGSPHAVAVVADELNEAIWTVQELVHRQAGSWRPEDRPAVVPSTRVSRLPVLVTGENADD